MKPAVTVRQLVSNVSAIRKAVAALTEQDVYIGIPAEKATFRKDGQPITNAELGYIHEFGAPAAGIPARPHLVPGITDIQPQAAELLKSAGHAALEKGDEAAVNRALKKIGLLGASAVKARFVNNDWPPLAEATLNAAPLKKDEDGNIVLDKNGKARRGKARKDRGKSKKDEGRVNPLIDTGQLRESYTYVIRKRGSTLITPEGKPS